MENLTSYLISSTVNKSGVVKAWSEQIMLPTYEIGQEEKNPIFLEKRVYQGSSGVVYPYAVVEKISDKKSLKAYNVVFLENKYIKVMIMPELGGRIQMAYDKVKKRHFVYYNQVIKPALVGLLGPWISGGIEFNWPQHHRPTTYLPTDVRIDDENSDGSKTVWCGEIERMFRTKGMQGFTLHPDKAYIEIKVQIYNRTPLPQTFLWWANPAVVVNDSYKSVFPPDVYAVFDHGKRDVSNFPIATGIYYKKDYSAGVDISKYKNVPVPTSYMAINSKYDFVGGYEDEVGGGLLHVADHHVSPGKKQWTWGFGDFGVAWDRNLTDEDGPYIELMTGVFTDNQPDFTWLQPYEEKSWTQYFMPYTEVGYVKNATKDFIMNIEVEGGEAKLFVYATGVETGIKVELKTCLKSLFETVIDISPERPFVERVAIGTASVNDLIFSVYDSCGNMMLSYQSEKADIKPTPDSAKAAKEPHQYKSIEQLFLTGQHLEQYRHATYNPLDYYFEGLNREPSDVRCNNAVGLMMIRRGKFAEAEKYLRTAVKTITERNPNPYDGEPLYNLAWALKMQGKSDEAYDNFYKSTWNAAWQDAGFLGVAQIDAMRGKWSNALEFVNKSLIRNWHNHKARALKTSILRKLGRDNEALALIDESLKIDGLNTVLYFEKYLMTGDSKLLNNMNSLMRGYQNSYYEYSIDYAAAGLYDEAIELLNLCLNNENNHPMVVYAMGYFYSQKGDKTKAKELYDIASTLLPDRCFPNKIEEVNILRDAIELNPKDAKAPYYLGNLYYGARQYRDAIELWESSITVDDKFPTVMRNLSLAYYNKLNKKVEARELLEKAFALDISDARVFMELDQLYKKLGVAPKERLDLLDKYMDLVQQRDDIYMEYITLLNLSARYTEAMSLISKRKFHPWEGGEGKITGQYVICRLELAKAAIKQGQFKDAIQLLKQTEYYPHNLSEGKLDNAQENEIHYYLALAYRAIGDENSAKTYFEKATKGSSEPVQAFFYNDQQPDKIFYQGLAWRALGDETQARSRFNKLISHGKKHLFDRCKIDYFAVSLPDLVIWDDDMNVRNETHCYYVMALGYSGLGDSDEAEIYYAKVKELDVNKYVYRE